MFLYDVVKVIYSPVKAFREILANPKYLGPIIIIIISLFLTMGTQYVSSSKYYIETITPSNRVAWTNMTDPSSMWTSNGTVNKISQNSSILVGNYSVIASIPNSRGISLKTKTDSIGTINCSEESGFRTFYYKLWYNSTLAQKVSNAILRFVSFNNESNYFQFDLLSNAGYLNNSGTWINANVTLPHAPVTSVSGWTIGGSPDWSNITGIEFRLGFPQNGNLSIQLNDLNFGGKYQPLIDVEGFANWLSSNLVISVLNILVRWLIFAALLWLTIKVFHAEGSAFRTLMIIVGYTFAITFVYLPIEMLSVSQLRVLYFPYRVWFPTSTREIGLANTAISNIFATNWTSTAPYIASIAVAPISYAWTIGLFTIALKTLHSSSWKRAFIISLVAYVMALVLSGIVLSVF